MPIEANTGKSGKQYREQWEECSRCGFFYPFSLLVRQPGDKGGDIVCTVSCLDEPSSGDYRQNELPTEKPLDLVDD